VLESTGSDILPDLNIIPEFGQYKLSIYEDTHMEEYKIDEKSNHDNGGIYFICIPIESGKSKIYFDADGNPTYV